MLVRIAFIFQLFFSLFKSDHSLYIENILLKKENEILKRKLNLKRINVSRSDKLFLVFLNIISDIRSNISIVSPHTLLLWQHILIKNFWTSFKPRTHPGRPPVPAEVKKLILEMKNENLNWGTRRIRDELLKLNIDLHRKTIQNILLDFRRRGKIKKSITWKKFLKSHIESLFAMDYFTVDTILNKRYYVFFMISHKTREIVQFAITQNPTREFVKQQLIEFEQHCKNTVHLIHDRDSSFMNIDYLNYGIKDVATSVKAPNMNSIAERFVRTVRNEAIDNFVILNQNQLGKILTEFITFYNTKRPHQGIKAIPGKEPPDIEKSDFSTENIRKKSVLGDLHHHYFRDVA